MTNAQQLGLDLVRPQLDLNALCSEDEREGLVALALEWGRANARQIKDISAMTGIEPRQVQAVVEHLILEHHWPIGTAMSEPYGNYLIDSAEDLDATVDLLRARGISNLVRAAALKRIPLLQYLDLVQTDLRLEAKRS